MERKLLEKTDLALLLAAVLLACGVLLWRALRPQTRLTAVITVNGVVTETVALSALEAPLTITPATDPPLTIVAEPGAIAVVHAECRDQRCVACGRLTKPGDTAVCLPAKTVVTVRGGDVDAITY
ncbi:MAG: NusG domain II-containing protein [Clostridia bacterium]|nr:NusG domain II-containing protein [Clostridia bacterium]